MESIFQQILDFCNNNVVLLAIVSVLTVVTLILDKCTKLFHPLKEIILHAIATKRQKQHREQQLFDSVAQLTKLVEIVNRRLTANDDMTHGLSDKLDELNKKVSDIKDKTFENEKDRLKSELFVYGNRCRRKMPLALDEYRHISDVYKKYHDELNCNGDGQREFEFITAYFNDECMSQE